MTPDSGRHRFVRTIGSLSLIGRGMSNPIDLAIGQEDTVYTVNRSNFDQEEISVRISVFRVNGDYAGRFSELGQPMAS